MASGHFDNRLADLSVSLSLGMSIYEQCMCIWHMDQGIFVIIIGIFHTFLPHVFMPLTFMPSPAVFEHTRHVGMAMHSSPHARLSPYY